jgi:hypothetical protein
MSMVRPFGSAFLHTRHCHPVYSAALPPTILDDRRGDDARGVHDGTAARTTSAPAPTRPVPRQKPLKPRTHVRGHPVPCMHAALVNPTTLLPERIDRARCRAVYHPTTRISYGGRVLGRRQGRRGARLRRVRPHPVQRRLRLLQYKQYDHLDYKQYVRIGKKKEELGRTELRKEL